MGRRTRRAEGMNTPLDFSEPVLSRSVDLTNAQDSWWFSVLVTRTPWSSYAHAAPSFSPYQMLFLTPSPGGRSLPYRRKICVICVVCG